jgi:uncharacterized protein involved in cysteine biosynthesis
MPHRLERRHEPLASRRVFLRRLGRYTALSAAIIFVSLGIGVLGYHVTEGLPWLDSLLNPVRTAAGKWFASFYALFSGMVLLVAVGVLIAPVFHRFLHRFHLEIDDGR